MAKAKVGDRVRFLNDVGGGVVARVDGGMVYVEDEDGFLTPVLDRECVVVADAASMEPERPRGVVAETDRRRPVADNQETPRPQQAAMAPKPQPEEKFHETPEGEKLNVTLAFEPLDIRQLSSTTWDVVLVNDSNYYLSLSLLCRGAGDESWTFLRATSVEPAMQVRLAEVDSADIPALDFMAVQYIAYKTDGSFSMKQPASVELKIDTTKFFKLHCYKPNPYFDSDVIALEIVTDDVPVGKKKVDADALRRAMLASKKAADMRPERKPLMKRQRHRDTDPTKELVVDLHITELVDNVRGLTPADMLNRQIDEFREVMDANLRNKGRKIIFIHGKGEGVLRNALLKELTHRYKGHDVQDASFREYGFGATQVIIR